MTIAERLANLEAQLREVLARLEPPAAAEHPDDLVDVAWIAELFQCAERSVQQGKAGTRGIVFVRKRPLKARRGQVLKIYENYVGKESAAERTLKLLNRRKRGQRTSGQRAA